MFWLLEICLVKKCSEHETFQYSIIFAGKKGAIRKHWLCKICRLRHTVGIFHLTKNANFVILTALRSQMCSENPVF